MLAMLGPQADADAVKGVLREILPAHRIATLDGFDELAGRGGEVGNHHLPAAPEIPHGTRKHDGPVQHLPAAHVLRPLQFGKELPLPLQQEPGLTEFPWPQRVVHDCTCDETEFPVAPEL
ncbi:MAG: hypothetical protein NT176_15480 [Proteobacteria bacterium]|nr:hypothetical protein [Pseudomonadota bacterium]